MKAILGALALVAIALPAFAQGASTAAQSRPNLATARAYVGTVAVASEKAGVLGRWSSGICPGVVGVSAANAQTIIDQIARRANAVGVHTGAAGCAPNISIFVSRDGNMAAQDIDMLHHDILAGANGIESSSLGSAALQSFITTARPVRWWHVSQTVMADGHVLSDNTAHAMQGNGGASSRATTAMASGSGSPSGGGEGLSGVDVTRSSGSRLTNTTRQDFSYVVVIVDASRINGAPLSAIADYIAFVALAQVNADVQTANYPSILNLFDAAGGQPAPTAMTAWDIGYLNGLYHMTPNARNMAQQEDEIARRIAGA